MAEDKKSEDLYLEEIKKLIKDMKYGSLTLIVQDGIEI